MTIEEKIFARLDETEKTRETRLGYTSCDGSHEYARRAMHLIETEFKCGPQVAYETVALYIDDNYGPGRE